MTWETWFSIVNILQDESMHFVLAAISGLLAFSLMWIMCYAAYRILTSRSHASLDTASRSFITSLALGYGLLAAWFSHTTLDLLVAAYNAPLGPHLPLILK
jgi:multisubunit Na+/H+ antiporter MnhB subunit